MSDTKIDTLMADATKKTSETTRQGLRGVENATRNAEAVTEKGMAMVTDMANKNAEAFALRQREVAEITGEAGRRIIDASERNLSRLVALMAVPCSAEGGLKEMQHGIAGLVDGVMQTNIKLIREMLQPKTPQAYLEMQQQFVQEYLESLWEGTAMIVRATRRIAEESLPSLEKRLAA